MKQTFLLLTFLLFIANLKGQAPAPIVTGLTDPSSLLLVGTDLYVTETGPNNRIIKVDPSGTTPVSPTIVATGLNVPRGMVRKGNYIYFCQTASGEVSRFNYTSTSPTIELVALVGAGPTSLAIKDNFLYVVKSAGHQVARIDLNASFPTGHTTLITGLSSPWGIEIYGNIILVSESGSANITGFDLTLGINPPPISITTAGLNNPKGISLDGSTLFIAEDAGNRISRIDLAQSYPITPDNVTLVLHPQDVIPYRDELLISEWGTDEVVRRLNPLLLDSLTTANPSTSYYTGNTSNANPVAGSNNPDSWRPVGVPNSLRDVVVFPIYGLEIRRNMDINSLTALDNSFVNIFAAVKLHSLSQFGVNSIINWVSGELYGNTRLHNRGQINCTTSDMILRDGLTLANYGGFRFETAGNLWVRNATFHNYPTGIVKFDYPGTGLIKLQGSVRDSLINEGLIHMADTGTCTISAELHNTGVIQVDQGRLELSSDHHLYDGTIINLDLGSTFFWNYTSNVYTYGVISGVLDGDLIVGHGDIYSTGVTNFDFSGSKPLQIDGTNFYGGGVLNFKSDVSVISAAGTIPGLRNDMTINNEANFAIASTGSFAIYSNGIFNNLSSGVIDLQSTGGFAFGHTTSSALNNMGLIKKSASTGISFVQTPLHNSGTMQIDSGTLVMTDTLHNLPSGIIKGTATIDLPTPNRYINEGTYSPGASSGKLNVIGDFESESSAILDIELNGLVQESEYDLITIQGAADVNGSIDLDLGFDPTIGDTFTILTSTGTLTSALPSTIMATSPTNDIYTFNVQKIGNSIVLEVIDDCQDNRNLNGGNTAGTYKAGLNLTVTNIIVPATTVFSAPNVLLNQNVTIQDGQLFEVNQVGCN